MTISDTTILQLVKAWTITVDSGGTSYKLERIPSRTMSLEIPRNTCSFPVIALPTMPSGTATSITLGLNGESTTFFTGTVANRPLSSDPSYEIHLYDILGRTNRKLGTALTWNNTAFATGVRQALNALGIDDSKIDSIHEPGSDFVLGPVYPIEIEANQTGRSVLDTLMAFGGTGMFVTPEGTVKVVDFPGWPDDAGTIPRVYANGADRSAGEFGVVGPPRRTIGGNEDVVRSFKAYGPRRPDRQIPDATFTLSGVSDGEDQEQRYAYLQTTATAQAIAEREIVRQNRQSTEVELVAPLHPELRPGDSILFRDPDIGFPTSTPAIIISIQTNDDLMTMLLSVGAQPAEGEVTIIPPPTANFTMQFEQQLITLEGVSAVRTVVQCTDTSSDGEGFSLTSRQWTAACNGEDQPQPATSSEVDPLFIFPTLDGASINLVIESSSGEGAEVTRAVVPASGEAFTRALALAAGSDGWWVLAEAAGWRSFDAATVTAVPGINDNGPLLGGTSGGDLYRTDDLLATPPALLASFSGSIGNIFVNEGNQQIILVGAGSTLHRSVDGGTSWSAVYTFDDTITYCESAPNSLTSIRVCAGESLWISNDGSSFTALATGPTGSICRKVLSAPWGHLMVFSGTLALADAWAFEEPGFSIDWSGVDPALLPIELSTGTPLQYANGYVVADGCDDLIRDGLFGQLTYAATSSPGARFYLLTETSPGQFAANFITTADLISGAMKLVNHGSAFQIAAPSNVTRIGYGAAIAPFEPPQLVVLPDGQTGDMDKLWHYIPLTGWQPKDLPASGALWKGFIVNPNNHVQWLMWHDSGAYYSGDSGMTWTQIYHPTGSSFIWGAVREYTITALAWTGAGNSWMLNIEYYAKFGAPERWQSYVAYGSGPGNFQQRTNGDYLIDPEPASSDYVLFRSLATGYDLDAAGHAVVSGGGSATSIAYVNPADLAPVVVGVSEYVPVQLRDPASGTEMLYSWNQNVGLSANYRTTLPTAVIAGGGSVAVCQAGIFCGSRTGIVQITDFDTNPQISVVAAASESVGAIVAGSRRRGVAARASNTIYALNADGQWAAVTLPDGLNPASALGMVEP